MTLILHNTLSLPAFRTTSKFYLPSSSFSPVATRRVVSAFRLIARDELHSQGEQRYYCFGKVAGRVVTVRFTLRSRVIRIIGAGYWRKGKKRYEEAH
jgi:uncharacterized DUF497 family protein